jgi:hypothetical protein
MEKSNRLRPTLHLLAAGLVAAAAAALMLALPLAMAMEKPTQEWDGLVPRYNDKLENVWVRPNVQFKAYKRIRLPPVEVTFARDWDPDRGSHSPSSEEIDNIRSGLSEMFHKEFAKQLAKGGYVLTDKNDDDVLIVQAALANLYVNGPEASNSNLARAQTMTTGRVSVVMQLSDSVTQQLLARVVDTQYGDERGNLAWSSSVASSEEARRIIDIWAYALRLALDKVNK